MTQLLYEADKDRAYVPGLSLESTKSRNVLGGLLETKKLLGDVFRPSPRSYWKPSSPSQRKGARGSAALYARGRVSAVSLLPGRSTGLFWKSYSGWPRDIVRTMDGNALVYVGESSFREAVSSSTKLTGPIQFLAELLATWRLEPESAALLLGQEPSYDVGKLLRGDAQLSGRDVKDRIACLFRIRKNLSSLFRDKDTENAWLREQHNPLGGQTPVEMLLEGSMEDMLTVKEYVDWMAGR